jgi:hypothetical protein
MDVNLTANPCGLIAKYHFTDSFVKIEESLFPQGAINVLE